MTVCLSVSLCDSQTSSGLSFIEFVFTIRREVLVANIVCINLEFRPTSLLHIFARGCSLSNIAWYLHTKHTNTHWTSHWFACPWKMAFSALLRTQVCRSHSRASTKPRSISRACTHTCTHTQAHTQPACSIMNWMVRQMTELEVNMNSVERMVEYNKWVLLPTVVEKNRGAVFT